MKKTKLLLATLISMFAFTCGVKAIEVNTEEEFISVMNKGEDIKLTENIEVNSTITLDKEVELDLNGKEILNYVDVLVDGQYKDELHDFNLKWRGSSNQRVIDVKKSLKKKEVILLEEAYEKSRV